MRAQAHTLEGIVAAFLVISSVIIALQVTAVTPLTASTASQHIEMQERASTAGVLSSARAERLIRPTLLYWNATAAKFHGAGPNGYYTEGGPPTEFGRLLNTTYAEDGFAFNVAVRFVTVDGNIRSSRLVYMGRPSDNAAAASTTLTLYDDDRLRTAAHAESGQPLNGTAYLTDDLDVDSHLYGIVDVEVIVWRM